MLHVFVLLLLLLVFYHVRYVVRLCVVTNASYVAYLSLFSFCCCCLHCPCFVLPDCWCSVLMLPDAEHLYCSYVPWLWTFVLFLCCLMMNICIVLMLPDGEHLYCSYVVWRWISVLFLCCLTVNICIVGEHLYCSDIALRWTSVLFLRCLTVKVCIVGEHLYCSYVARQWTSIVLIVLMLLMVNTCIVLMLPDGEHLYCSYCSYVAWWRTSVLFQLNSQGGVEAQSSRQ